MRELRSLAGLSVRKAATLADFSEGRWRQIENGYQVVSKDQLIDVVGPPATVARMAFVVGGEPEDFVVIDRTEVAFELQSLIEAWESAGSRPVGETVHGRPIRRFGGLSDELDPDDQRVAMREALDQARSMGLSSADLARITGIHESVIDGFLAGRQWPSREELTGIERALGYAPGVFDALAHGSDPHRVGGYLPADEESATEADGPVLDRLYLMREQLDLIISDLELDQNARQHWSDAARRQVRIRNARRARTAVPAQDEAPASSNPRPLSRTDYTQVARKRQGSAPIDDSHNQDDGNEEPS